jgi:hypothetical protein
MPVERKFQSLSTCSYCCRPPTSFPHATYSPSIILLFKSYSKSSSLLPLPLSTFLYYQQISLIIYFFYLIEERCVAVLFWLASSLVTVATASRLLSSGPTHPSINPVPSTRIRVLSAIRSHSLSNDPSPLQVPVSLISFLVKKKI